MLSYILFNKSLREKQVEIQPHIRIQTDKESIFAMAQEKSADNI